MKASGKLVALILVVAVIVVANILAGLLPGQLDLTAGKTASRRAKTPEEEFAAFASWAEARKH